jgi:hypothetical protein
MRNGRKESLSTEVRRGPQIMHVQQDTLKQPHFPRPKKEVQNKKKNKKNKKQKEKKKIASAVSILTSHPSKILPLCFA